MSALKLQRPNLINNLFQLGDTVFVETTQRNLLHKKFADRYKGPYKVLELLANNNLKLVPLDNGPTISTHINNCKPGLVRPVRLEVNDTTRHASPPPTRDLDPFRFSIPANLPQQFLEDEDNDLLPAPPLAEIQPDPPAPLRTPVRPAPDDVLEYVYDQLPLERILAKMFKEKQQPPKK